MNCNKTNFLWLFSLILLLPILTGCQSDYEQSAPGRIAIIFPQKPAENPFWLRIRKGAESAARDSGVELLIFSGSQYDTDKEIAAVEAAIREQPDGLLISPTRPDALVPVVEKAIARDIPVIVYDAPLNSDKVITETRFDGVRGGALIGEWVSERLGGTGKVLILDGGHDSVPGLERRQGIEQGLRDGQIEILDVKSAHWQRGEAYSITTEWMNQFDQVDAILAANDDMALGAADAVTKSQRQGIIITGIDGNPNALQAIKEGYIHATVDQVPAEIGYQVVRLMEQYLKDNKPLPPRIKWQKTPLIHQQNIDQHLSVHVVHTGIEVCEIREFNQDNFTVFLDFILWFRYQNDIPDEIAPEEIVFLNAAEYATLGKQTYQQEAGAVIYRAYRISSRFKANFLPGYPFLDKHVIGISFRHKHIDRKHLIYTPDVLGMGGVSFAERMKRDVPAPEYEWTIDDAGVFQDIIKKNIMGLKYLDPRDKFAEYSRFNFWIYIKKETFRSGLQEKFPDESEGYLAMFSCAMAVLLAFASVRKFFSRFLQLKSAWFFQTVFAFLLLLSAEALLKALLGETDTRYLEITVLAFDVLWWLIPALFMHLALEPFIWLPMHKRTCRPVPNVLRRFSAYIIYFLALYGIIVYVFDQDINKLMATSGVIAMVVSLIIKSNISDFFSGIVVNQGDAIRIGDWVKIGSFEEGKVVDITWRSTSLETRDGSFLSIPNSDVLDAGIHNYSYPDDHYRSEINIEIDPVHRYERVEKILLDAALSVNDVLISPGPAVSFSGQGDASVIYAVAFSVKDYAKKDDYVTSVRKRVRTHLEYAGIEGKGTGSGKTAGPLALLQGTDIFQPCSDEAKSSLARQMRSHCVLPGETVIQEGDGDDSLFIIAEGVVGVWVQLEDGEPAEIARIGPGDIVGEMALLTGEPRMARLISVTETHLFEITKADIAPFMKEHPEMIVHLQKILTDRKMETESKKETYQSRHAEKEVVYPQFFHKIRGFFGLKT